MKFADEGRIRGFVAQRGEEAYVMVVDMANKSQITRAICTALRWAGDDELAYTMADAMKFLSAIRAEIQKLPEDTDGK